MKRLQIIAFVAVAVLAMVACDGQINLFGSPTQIQGSLSSLVGQIATHQRSDAEWKRDTFPQETQ